ncbi:MAG: 50S ribosomal protein L9 [Crocinitomicaceae bacterium]|nr:50S ribosomal protein L9 [Crocinitomicaceae bacterium]MBK8925718.1 50S ribosomal protein L9 [Crocinitomicaceae bacterium]
MELILKKNVDKLGFKDEVVKVRPGYGRNFLIPQGYAVLATESAKKAHAEVMKQRSHKDAKIKEEASGLAAKLAEMTVKVAAKAGDSGKIFGSVTTVQLSEALKAAGVDVERKSLKIVNEPIREVGTFEAVAILHKDVKQNFKFEVVAD